MNKKQLPKVLLACPTSNIKLYCQKDWFDWISKLDYPNYDILIVENSKTPENSELIKSYNIPNLTVLYVGAEFKDRDKYNLREIMTFCTNLIFKYFLNRNYDYWLSLESDVFPPKETIQHLIALNKSVAGLPYFHGGADEPPRLISHDITLNFSMPKTSLETFGIANGDLMRPYQCGIGCTLFKRHVVKDIGLLEYRDTVGGEFPDAFILDKIYQDFNYLPFIDSRFYCLHLNNEGNWRKLRRFENL
ncbi:MAG: hypothetical protein DRJ01_08870 [Bacteroidetes bacterium]|nr:MAG: hypothetical protein DRJ01_08870 [Bacteroidota bacterium]